MQEYFFELLETTLLGQLALIDEDVTQQYRYFARIKFFLIQTVLTHFAEQFKLVS
jgi:hypothetical protein